MSVAVKSGAGLPTGAAANAATQPASTAIHTLNSPFMVCIIFFGMEQASMRSRLYGRDASSLMSSQIILLLQRFVQRVEDDLRRQVTVRQNDRRFFGVLGINQHEWHSGPA